MARLVPRAIPLRVGLVAAMLALVALGLVASGVAVTSTLRHTLLGRVDQTLTDASRGWAQAPRFLPPPPAGLDVPPPPGPDAPPPGPFGPPGPFAPPPGPYGPPPTAGTAPQVLGPARPPTDFYVRAVGPNGDLWVLINDRNVEPALPADNDVGRVPVTVGSLNGSGVLWRAVSVEGPQGQIVTIAMELESVRSTVRALVWSQVGIGLAVLVILGVVGYVVVHRSLRPLVEVEKTAAAIAAGELDSRVPQRDPRTEVGRLSEALNGMLAQIQRAVASSDESAEQARQSEMKMRRFVTDASHELRTPLTVIRGFAELYRQGAARDMEMVMSRIEGESQRMGLLVEDLLLLARLDAQRPLDETRVDLLSLATDAVHDAQAVAPNRRVILEVFDGPGTPEVLGDEARLRQVLSNLVGNALQHTPESASITVRVGTEADDAILEVIDEGPGMSPEDAQRVFERFYRADSSRARASGGTGLGLSIVDSLVEAHGGTVTMVTKRGQGCKFEVRLPRVADDPDQPS